MKAAMPPRPPAWYDDQYNNRARIPEHPAILQHWFDSSAQARAELPCKLDLPYGPAESEKLDIFGPATARDAPVLVYIHGGYWRALDKKDQSFVAAPFVKAGAVVVLPNHALAPAVSVRHIVLQMVQAVAWVHRHIAAHGGNPKHIVVAGHSAGGHLATMMLACQWQHVAADLPAHLVQAALSISGVFDVEPLRHAPFLAPDLQLDAAQARALSPALMPPPRRGHLAAVVGGEESEEFQRQNRLIRRAWGARAVPVCETVPGRNHMNVLNALAEPGSRLHSLALGLLGLEPAKSLAPQRSLADRLQACTSSVVHDVMKDMGLPIRVLPRTITGLASTMKAAGPVFTVRGRPDPTLDKHTSLFEWAGLLSKSPAGHVVICQPQDDVRALFGGLSAEALQIKGVRGYIADGGCRDIADITAQGFPVFARYATPIDIVCAWRAEAFGEPIAMGNVQVLPDDFVLADRDGIVLIPCPHVEAVITAAEKKLSTEGARVKAIRAGMDPQAAYLKHRVF